MKNIVLPVILAIASLLHAPLTFAQSLDAKEQAQEIVDHMERIAQAYRSMGLDAPTWRELQRYEDNLVEVLDRDNQKAMLCGFASYSAYVAATLAGRVPEAGNDDEFPPGSLIDWLLHYSEPFVEQMIAGTIEYEEGLNEVTTECMMHRFVFVVMNDTPMHEIDVAAEEECLRGGPCPHRDSD